MKTKQERDAERKAKSKGKLRVYGWRGSRSECPPAVNGSHQTREICAAPSRAAALRAAGDHRPAVSEICTTGNPFELIVARANPGVVLWRPNYARNDDLFFRDDNGQVASTLKWKYDHLFSDTKQWSVRIGLIVLLVKSRDPQEFVPIVVGASRIDGVPHTTLYQAQRAAIEIARVELAKITDGMIGA
jgi:hypothetical protein